MPLTLRQFAQITLYQKSPPWHLKRILQINKLNMLSCSTAISNLSQSRAIVYLSVRDINQISTVNSLGELKGKIRQMSSNKATVQSLGNYLNKKNCSIVSISRDWKTVGIMGTYEDFMNLNFVNITNIDILANNIEGDIHLDDRGDGIIAAATGLFMIFHGTLEAVEGVTEIATGIAAAGETLGLSTVITILGAKQVQLGTAEVAAGGAIFGVGWDKIMEDDKPKPTSDLNENSPDGSPQIYGYPPAGVDPNNPASNPLNIDDLAEQLAESIGDNIFNDIGGEGGRLNDPNGDVIGEIGIG